VTDSTEYWDEQLALRKELDRDKRITELEAENAKLLKRHPYQYRFERRRNDQLEAERDAASQDYADLLTDYRALREAAQAAVDMIDEVYRADTDAVPGWVLSLQLNLKAVLGDKP
jgi:hypothetical protein